MGSLFHPSKKFAVTMLAAAITLTACDKPNDKPGNDDADNDGVISYLERDIRDDVFYFVMPDRFNNGSLTNDYGDLSGDKSVHGFDPTDKGYYHGGDIVGLKDKLDYLENMGVTAIWMTPILKNKAVQGDSSGYHGYWTLDFTQIDPHLGSNDDLKDLIAAAHERDIKVFFDIITNHTADVIKYEECHEADGTPILDSDDVAVPCTYKSLEDVANGDTYTPFIPAGEENVKVPAWLNDIANYHNQGETTYSGENSIYGDFSGLDDLATSDPDVIDGLTEIFKDIVTDFKPDGFRIDTVKHVNTELWKAFSPAVVAHAKEQGIPNFTMFGEVYSSDTDLLSFYTTEAKLPSVLDFGIQSAISSAVKGGATPSALKDLFENDDKYADADSDASTLMNFIGNHDMGRFASGLSDTEDDLAKTKLAHAMMYFLRGVPVVYYGDEQGFTGDGGDKDAREDMFVSQVDDYNDNELIGTSLTTADDNFDATHPLYEAFAEYAEVLAEHVALRRGIQHERFANDATKGLYVVSRVDSTEKVEYVVAFNTSNIAATEYVPAAASGYTGVYGFDGAAVIDGSDIELTVPAYGMVILKANEPVTASPETTVALTGVEAGSFISGRVEIGLDIAGLSDQVLPTYAAAFEYSTDAGATWTAIAIDKNAPYRAFFRAQDIADGTEVTIRASVTNGATMAVQETVTATVDSRYPETVTIQYPNGNTRDALYVVSSGGEFQEKIVGNAGEYEMSWGENDEANLLIFATLDDDAGTVVLDKPYLLTRNVVLTASTDDGNGNLVASISVDQLTAVDLSLTTDDQIVVEGQVLADAATPPVTLDGLNIRGGIVGWGQADAVDMTNTEFATYHAEVMIAKGDGEFKFADDAWAAINAGGPITVNGLTQAGNPANLLNNFEAASVYDFWVVGVDEDGDDVLDMRVPFIEIDHGNMGELIYLRGDLTSWDPSAQMIHQGGNMYTLTVDLAVGDYIFKIGGATWDNVNVGFGDFSAHADSEALTDAGSGNIGLNIAADTTVEFTLDATDVNNLVLNANALTGPGFKVFFKKPAGWGATVNIHHWDAETTADSAWPGDLMTDEGDGYFSFQFDDGTTSSNIIFNDGTSQTGNLFNDAGDVCFDENGTIDGCMPHLPDSQLQVYFELPAGWTQAAPNVHYWDANGGIANTNWPGAVMTATGTGNWYSFEFPVGTNSTNIIFNDGNGNQTGNLQRTGDGCYSNDAWADFCTDNPQP